MVNINISLPDEMKAFVDGRLAGGQYSTASDHVDPGDPLDRIARKLLFRSDPLETPWTLPRAMTWTHDVLTPVTAGHDMIDRVGVVKAQSSWHALHCNMLAPGSQESFCLGLTPGRNLLFRSDPLDGDPLEETFCLGLTPWMHSIATCSPQDRKKAFV